MIMNNLKKKIVQKVIKKSSLLAGILLLLTGACSQMDDTYKDFWKDGEIIYPAIPDSVKVLPGKNRIQLQWLLSGDASIRNAKVVWNAGNDSTVFPIEPTGGIDTVSVILSDLTQGFYVFDITHHDDKGNTSLSVSTIGEVYGSNYESLLLNRSIKKALFDAGMLELTWQDFSDNTYMGSELSYIDNAGQIQKKSVDPGDSFTVLDDFDYDANEGFIKFKSVYLPQPAAIDTFYTANDSVKAIGPPVPYSRAGWTISANSENDASRSAAMTLDGDPGTYWWTGLAEENMFPFILTIDMGEIKDPVYGVFLQQRASSNPLVDLFEIQISDDGVNYRSVGMYNAGDHSNEQFFDFMQVESFRYFKVLCHSVYRDKPRCSLAEVGIYSR